MAEDTHAAGVDEPTNAGADARIDQRLRCPHVYRVKYVLVRMNVEMNTGEVMNDFHTLEKHT
jgi:hypothetical protein